MAITFNLSTALNNVGTAGQAVFGDFRLGTYTGGGHAYTTFSVFDKYQYQIGAPYTIGQPYNTNALLGWCFPNVFPSNTALIGIENINGNSGISSSDWSYPIVMLPNGAASASDWTNAAARPSVIRHIAGSNETISVSGLHKKTGLAGITTGFTILKNGVPVFARTVNNGSSATSVSVSGISLISGDVLDFVVDSDVNIPTGQKSVLDLTLTIDSVAGVTQTPNVVLGTTTLDCSSTVISGTIPLTQSGTVTLSDSTGYTISTATISPISGTPNGSWSFSGLDLSTFGGTSLILTAINPPNTTSNAVLVPIQDLNCAGCDTPMLTTTEVFCDTTEINGTVDCKAVGNKIRLGFIGGGIITESSIVVSGIGGAFSLSPLNLIESKGMGLYIVMIDSLGAEISSRSFVIVGDMGCKVEDYAPVPVVTVSDLCKKKCSYQRTLTGTADFDGEVLIFKAPFDPLNPELVSTGIISGGIWTSRSENIKDRVKYVAIGIRHDGIEGGEVTIDAVQNCEKECVLTGTVKGTVGNVDLGILNIYAVPFSTTDLPIATTRIVNEQWTLKDDVLLEDTDYVLYAIKLNAI